MKAGVSRTSHKKSVHHPHDRTRDERSSRPLREYTGSGADPSTKGGVVWNIPMHSMYAKYRDKSTFMNHVYNHLSIVKKGLNL
jgi:hypothetical protein